MANEMTVAVGFAMVLGFGVTAQELTTRADQIQQTEVAPGTSILPLWGERSANPRFVLMDTSSVAGPAETMMPYVPVTGTIVAFGLEGIRLPTYEPDIVTGSLGSTDKK